MVTVGVIQGEPLIEVSGGSYQESSDSYAVRMSRRELLLLIALLQALEENYED